MRMMALMLPAACALALSACDNQETAKAPATPESSQSKTAAAPAAPASPGTAAIAPAAPAAPATETAAVPQGEPTGEATGAVATTPANSKPTTGERNAAAAPGDIEPYRGRVYTAGSVAVRLNPDNTFEMNQTDGNQRATGRYDFQNGMIRFSEPNGNADKSQFPLQCRFEPTGAESFRLLENDGSCTQFKDLTFRAHSG